MPGKRILPRASCTVNCYLLFIGIIYCSHFFENGISFETIEVFEGLPPGSAILNLNRNYSVAYSLYHSSATADGSNLFYIDSNGILTSKVTLDHEDERGNVFDLVVISREISRTEGGLASIVRVRILDQNDHTPKFPKDLYTATVAENSPIGTFVSGLESVYASDLDSGKNSVQNYSIVAGNEAGKFEVDFHVLSGLKFLRLKTKAPIDREETPFFVLTVKVEDGGTPQLSSTAQIRVNILDENDQTPKFGLPSYSVAVSENVLVGTSVLKVNAFDVDISRNAEIYYYFKPAHDFFTVNAHTGIVETACELNFQKGSSFDLTIYAVDRGRNPRQAKTIVRIRLVDIAGFPPSSLGVISSERTPPVFRKHKYFVRIREDFPVGGAIVRVEAHQGSGFYTEEKAWRYVILNKPSIIQTIFDINPRSGVITLLEPLDYENKTSFSVIVKVKDEGSKDFYESQTRVKIVIEDVNENYFPPIFVRSTSIVSISENDREDSLVAKISASDADEGSNGKITYSITGGSGVGKFNIDRDNGKIRSLVPFNLEMASQFDLHVRASDRSKQPLHSNSFMLVRLQSGRQKRPFFSNPKQVVSVRENSEKGTFVALVRASLREGRSRSETPLEYFFSGGNQGGIFSLNSTSGIISTTASLDRESKDLYILKVHAREKGADPSMSSPSQVVVTVTDENDNTPSFDQHEYKVVVTENMGPISNLLCLAAYDPDAEQNGNITYSVISSTGPFSIDPAYGLLSVDKSLDYEQKQLHRLVVQAADNGIPSRKTRVTVEILVQDANDVPVFSQAHYTVTALESAKIATDLLAVFHVTDEDATVKVSIPEDSDVEGTVTILETSDQDRDKNGKFECSMEDMDLQTMDTFSVRRIPEGCALVLRSFLDWSTANQYSFTVRATDQADAAQRKSAVATVTIHVQDTNNHSPEFLQSSYWVSLPNDANIGTTVLTVKAYDLDEGDNAKITYKLSNDMFDVHPSKGVITLKQGFGSVTNRKYEFSVRATDQGTPNRQSAVSVSVSVHSLSFIPPKFITSVYGTLVPENFSTGVLLLTVHAEKSVGVRSSIEYYIVGGDPQDRFSVGTRSGVFTLRKSLDYEKAKQHVLVVRAVQKGLSQDIPSLPTEVKVFVNVTDVNDNYPRFALPRDPLVTSVNEFQPAGAVVATVKAFDKDSGNHSLITYGLKNLYNPYSGDFQIHRTLGTITTTKELLHSQGATRSFVVTATDSSHPFRKAEAKVVVMINQAIPPPQFDKEEFAEFIPENIHVGKSLVHFNPQQNARSFLKYEFVSGNDGNLWCLDITGKIRVNRRLHNEQGTSHHLKITVHDGSRVHRRLTALFNVDDVNDNAPKFTSNSYKFYILESAPEYHSVGTVSAEDYDEGSNSLVTYSIAGVEDARSVGKFEIDPESGLLKTARVLDRETMHQHVITVRAEDHGDPRLSSLTRVTVVVLDINDNDPVFATDIFSTWVPVDMKVGSSIFAVVAFDEDWGENGVVIYSVIGRNAEKFISLDPADGSIVLSRPLTSLKPIKFTVMARDLGNPVRNATADVVISINAVPGPPRFLLPSYVARVVENEKAGTEVVRLEVASVDPVISFAFLNGNDKGDFYLRAETGLITTARPLDYETVARYELIVMATDSSNKMNYVKVVVQVENVNDNEPVFVGVQGGMLEGQILVDAIAYSNVMWVKARDRDTVDIITYKILDERAASYFRIDFEGRLRTRKALTGLQSPYVFKIEASDSGIPSKRAVTSVRLVLLKYHTQEKELQATVAEDVKQDATVIKVKDSAGIKNARFSIVYPVGSPFDINEETGSLNSVRPLDFETIQNYSIIVQVQNSLDLNDYTNIDVVIKILDVNDNSPIFTMEKTRGLYLAKVNRNPVQGTVVYTLTASDRDSTGHLRYSLVSSDFNSFFEVEAESGNVKTRGQQGGLLTADVYNLTVRVSDSDTPSRHAEALLTVQVGEYPPVFGEEEYVFNVEENTQKGFTIGYIKARSFSGASLSYRVVHGRTQNKVSLDSNTGRLALPDPLDYERDSNVYYLRIRAEEVGSRFSRRQSSEVNVQILLKDLNDNSPEFSQQRYRYTLPESAPVGTTVLSVIAQDSDSGIYGQFRYYVENPFFAVNLFTGEITTTKPLDYETASSHTFVVLAQDGGSPALNGTAWVEVTLTNVNDNPPRFTQTIYNEYVTEDAGPGELVTTVQASDLDLDQVSYSIMSSDNRSNFVIDSRTGVVRLVKHRQPNLVGPLYVLNISASDGLHVSQAVLVVSIQDINNHKPVFKDCDKYRPVIAEDIAIGSPVIQVSAEDRDMGDNGKVIYHIERPTDGRVYFEIDSDSGLVTTAGTFDREKKRSYQIRITGKDGGSSRQEAERLMGFCQVEITIGDVNDNSPIFGNQAYTTNVNEDLEKGQIVLHVSATDMDAGSNALITYTFERPNLQFRISNTSGVITTRTKLKSSKYRFSVIAHDNGNPSKQSRADVVINVYKAGKNPPKFSKSVYTARVREDVLPQQNVTSVHATSLDPNNMIFYTIVNHPQPFSIDHIQGIVRSLWTLDYEKAANHTVHIRAQDTQNPPLVAFTRLEIFVEDVNDSPPEFPVSRYEGQVAENSPVGSSVIEVKAVDADKGKNGRVSYKFLREKSYASFNIDPVTGLISTKKVFDRERTGRYTLIVEARDSGDIPKASSCLVDVIISDKNDQKPAFQQPVYNVSVFEDIARGTRILSVTAVDDDIGNNAKVQYYITAGNEGAAFAINKDLGQIVVVSSLDRETQDYYQLIIRAQDGRNAGTAVVNILVKDVNDNNPKFSNNSYIAYVYENQANGSYVTTLSATDKDLGPGGKFLFSISGQGRDAFEIDASTGVMRTTKSLDREAKARYVFLAFATDNPYSDAGSRRTGSCDVEVRIRDKNDNPPRFPDGEYEGGVQENQLPGKEVMTMLAVDDDDPNENGNAVLSYQLLDDSEGLFKIDARSGLITTLATLDRESRDEYRLIVSATDRGEPSLSGQTEVKVRVTDANDHAPRFVKEKFEASVFENVSVDSSVMLINATDGDIGINAKLKFNIIDSDIKGEEDSSRMFRIVEGTGELRVARSLDYETKKEYHLKVLVRDSGDPSFSDTAEVTIQIKDYNDNPPVFSPVGYGTKVREDIDPGSYLMSVTARDSDTGTNKDFKYSIFEGNPDGQFRIDEDKGHVYVNQRLDRETQESYLLTIRATNIASPKLYGHATMKVTLIDVNDNGPTFHPSEFHFSVKENTAPSQPIGKISVSDPDGDLLNQGPFLFEIVSGNEDGFFALNNRTGDFSTKTKFDREKLDIYTLLIRASDSGTPKMSSDTRVFVHILDANDNPHSPGNLQLVLNSYQGKFPGGRVGKVYVVDKDTDDRRIYEVVTNDSDYFTVERMTGMIMSRPNPPKGRYFLTARVSDVSGSFANVICSVTIEVKEVTSDAIRNSMAIRLSGVQREGFVTTVLPRFKESVASILQTNEENVDLFSVQNAPKTDNAVDVRFAAHGSPYYAPERMTAILKNSRPNLSKALQEFYVNVLVIGVDECLYETCESGGCENELVANGEVEVISVKKTSFASIVAILTARCGDCDGNREETDSCGSKPCLNGGTCVEIPEGYICRCFGGYDGPNCELTTRSFEPGEWIWLPPPQQCTVGSLSLEFASREANGLLLYGGPTSPVGNGDVHDFITVELSGGKILVSMSLGDPNDVVRLGVTSGMALDDGEWHHVEVFRDKTLVRITVDKCRGAPLTRTQAKDVEDRSRCSSTARLKSVKNKMLNLNGPLQLGGTSNKQLRYPELTTNSYKGCIRNVISQGKYYDLKNPSLKNGTKERCPMMDQHCQQHQCHRRATCVPSWTGYTCSCPFGRAGRTCGQKTRALNYADGSFTKYLFYLRKFEYDPRETKIRMQIRTRDPNGGILMYTSGSEEGRFSSLEVVPYDIEGDGERELIVTYTLGSGKGGGRPAVVQLTGVNVGDGQWHNISVLRERRLLKLSVDSDSGGYTVTEHLGTEHALFVLDPTRTFIGGLHPPTLSRRRRDDAKDFVGCINDVQFNGHPLNYYNETSSLGIAFSVGVSEGCTAEPVCTPNPCIASEWCRDIWRKFVCLPRLCASRPCKNGGTCVEGVDSEGRSKFRCQCPRSFEGALCEVQSSVVIATESGIGLENGLIIGLSVLVVTLILSVLVLILYLRRSRPKKEEIRVGEEPFKRDNVANYRIEGGGEEDIEEQDHLRDILRSFETGDFSSCKLSGSSNDVSGPYVVVAPLKKETDQRQSDGIPGASKPVQKPVEPVAKGQKAGCSLSRDGSNEDLPDSCSYPSAVSTPERRRRICPSSKGYGEIKDRQTPEGGESGAEGSPTRKLTEVFGLSAEEQAGWRSPPEGFSSPTEEGFSSLGKRERGNGASLTRPAKTGEENKTAEENCESVCEPQVPVSFAAENPMSRPNSELRSASKEDGLAPVQRYSLPPRKPPRSYFPRGAPPAPGTFLPEDVMQKFCYEGSGSPTISLSTLGDTEGESEADDNYEYVNDMGDKFKKLAKIYGLPPSVSFSPHNEIIGE